MDIIISAIAGALGNLSSDAVKTGYRKLKELVLRKSGAAGGSALENWEKKPDSPAWKGALLEELEAAGADKDAEIIKAAEELLTLLEKAKPGGVQVTQHVSGSGQIFSGIGNVTVTRADG